MQAKTEISTGTARISEDPIAQAILSLVAVCKADYGDQWAKQFGGDEDLRMWKRRAYQKLQTFKPQIIVDGYDRAAKARRPYMPSLSDIVAAVGELNAERARIAERIEHVNAPRLPAGSGLAGYVEYLDAQAEGNVARGCIAMMREILARPDAKTEAERHERLDKAIAAHEKLLGLAPVRPRAYGERRECGKTGCTANGTMSHATNGEGPWFCVEHFRT
jgi:hypothetical protein